MGSVQIRELKPAAVAEVCALWGDDIAMAQSAIDAGEPPPKWGGQMVSNDLRNNIFDYKYGGRTFTIHMVEGTTPPIKYASATEVLTQSAPPVVRSPISPADVLKITAVKAFD